MDNKYTAYGKNNETVKTGIVRYEEGATDEATVSNFCEAVVADVGEAVFEEEVYGIREVQ